MENLFLVLKIFVTSIYIICLVILCIFGVHRYYLARTFLKFKDLIPKPKGKFQDLPSVTVQLPIFNELYVVERLIASVCEIDYPVELLEIQVLDDSTDETQEIAQKLVNRYRALGFQIHYIHRDNRVGFKAGALREGLKTAMGEFIAVFDSDFLPPKDFLTKTIDFFTDSHVGIVQVRWGHLNIDYSTLTKAQSILLDGHFLIEQASRFYGGRFFNFNGTAGVLRRRCINSSGGWQHDTLTEDLDLSYRAQICGWKLIYLKDVIAKAELPVDMNAFKSQQHRWVKGGIQTAKKLLPRILESEDIPIKVKIEAVFHLLGNLSYPLLLILLVLMVPMAYFWRSIGWEKAVLLNLIAITSGTLSIVRFYVVALKEGHQSEWKRYIKYIPLSLGIGTGLSINNSKAVFEAILGRDSDFRRTPKFAVTKKGDIWHERKYATSIESTTTIELLLGLTFVIQTFYAIFVGLAAWIPFLLIIQLGFIYNSILSIIHGSKRNSL